MGRRPRAGRRGRPPPPAAVVGRVGGRASEEWRATERERAVQRGCVWGQECPFVSPTPGSAQRWPGAEGAWQGHPSVARAGSASGRERLASEERESAHPPGCQLPLARRPLPPSCPRERPPNHRARLPSSPWPRPRGWAAGRRQRPASLWEARSRRERPKSRESEGERGVERLAHFFSPPPPASLLAYPPTHPHTMTDTGMIYRNLGRTGIKVGEKRRKGERERRAPARSGRDAGALPSPQPVPHHPLFLSIPSGLRPLLRRLGHLRLPGRRGGGQEADAAGPGCRGQLVS